MIGQCTKWKAVSEILRAADDNLKVARQRFTKSFGFEINDEVVEAEVYVCLAKAEALWMGGRDPDAAVIIPVEIVLALTLREGFRPKGRPRKSHERKHVVDLAIRYANEQMLNGIKENMKKRLAREKAIKDAATLFNVPESIIKDKMGRARKLVQATAAGHAEKPLDLDASFVKTQKGFSRK